MRCRVLARERLRLRESGPCLLYTSLRTEAVTVHAFEDNFLTIDINAIAGTVFDGAEYMELRFLNPAVPGAVFLKVSDQFF